MLGVDITSIEKKQKNEKTTVPKLSFETIKNACSDLVYRLNRDEENRKVLPWSAITADLGDGY